MPKKKKNTDEMAHMIGARGKITIVQVPIKKDLPPTRASMAGELFYHPRKGWIKGR